MVKWEQNIIFLVKTKKYENYQDFELTNTPDFGYELFVCKRGVGWLPLFQTHGNIIRSVLDYKKFYLSNDDIIICDEYGEVLSWKDFEKRSH